MNLRGWTSGAIGWNLLLSIISIVPILTSKAPFGFGSNSRLELFAVEKSGKDVRRKHKEM